MARHLPGAPGADCWQSVRVGRARAAGRIVASVLAALVLLTGVSPRALGEVTALGDVFPEDLPGGGGAASADVVVGGTGMMINETDTGQLIIDVPTETAPLTSNRGTIGGTAEGSGLVQIFTIGSSWRINNELLIGEFGQGTLELINGGEMSGGASTLAFDVIIGKELGSQGFANLRGTGSILSSGSLIVGQAGFGQMNLITRSRVTTLGEAVIGDLNQGNEIGTGFVTVDGQLTRWNVGPTTTVGAPGRLVVGRGGRGVLNITNQGEVRVTDDSGLGGDLILGELAGSYGEINVSNQFSQLWSFGTINVGLVDNARGVLRSSSGGLVRANQAITIGVDGVLEVSGGTVLTPVGIFNNGTIQTSVGGIGQIDSTVQNNPTGEIRAAGTLDRVRERLIFTRDVGNEGLVTSIGGEMEFLTLVTNDAAGTIAGRDAIYRFRGGLTNDGILGFSVGASDVFGNVINNGTVAVGHHTDVTFYDDVADGVFQFSPTGTAFFLQDLTFTAASALNLQISASAGVVEVSQLQVVGDLTLAGAIDVTAIGSLNPQAGDSYTLITGSNISTTFDTEILPSAPTGFMWDLVYQADKVLLQYVAGTAPSFNADWDGDGTVTALDLAIWQANFGMMVAPGTSGDANGDGLVDGADFMIWQGTLGTMPPATPASGAVPEPASAALLALALAFVARRRVK